MFSSCSTESFRQGTLPAALRGRPRIEKETKYPFKGLKSTTVSSGACVFYLRASDQQSASVEAAPQASEDPGEGISQKAVGDELQSSLTELADPSGEKTEDFDVKLGVILDSTVETHPKTASEGRSGSGASVPDATAGGAAPSLSTYQSHTHIGSLSSTLATVHLTASLTFSGGLLFTCMFSFRMTAGESKNS